MLTVCFHSSCQLEGEDISPDAPPRESVEYRAIVITPGMRPGAAAADFDPTSRLSE